MRAKIILLACVCLLVGLQYSLWFGTSGHFARERLNNQLQERELTVSSIRERNILLMAEVLALKADERHLEARARHDLGMVKQGEIFYIVPETN